MNISPFIVVGVIRQNDILAIVVGGVLGIGLGGITVGAVGSTENAVAGISVQIKRKSLMLARRVGKSYCQPAQRVLGIVQIGGGVGLVQVEEEAKLSRA